MMNNYLRRTFLSVSPFSVFPNRRSITLNPSSFFRLYSSESSSPPPSPSSPSPSPSPSPTAQFKCPFGTKPQPNWCPSKPLSSSELIGLDDSYGAHNYHPLPVVFSRAKGSRVWDPEGKVYFDFLSGYSALNQGHCHPAIISALVTQASKLTLSSRAFYNDVWPRFAQYITQYFNYERVLPMNSGAEGVETALKLAKKWGYLKKGIPENRAQIIHCSSCFHGRTMAAISMSDDPDAYQDYGPYLPGFVRVPYNNLSALEESLSLHHETIAGFLVEPIQGEAGVIVPDEGYLIGANNLCKKYDVLFIADEIQTGLARTGKMLASDWERVRPDIVILGKALSGGVFPISAVLADSQIMLTIKPGQHGSTFGGSPLASAVAIAALQVIKDENLVSKAHAHGEKFRSELQSQNLKFVEEVRGKGLLNAIEINPSFHLSAWQICLLLKDKGLLCKPTHDNIIRLAPPLVITDSELDEAIQILKQVLSEAPNISADQIPKH